MQQEDLDYTIARHYTRAYYGSAASLKFWETEKINVSVEHEELNLSCLI